MHRLRVALDFDLEQEARAALGQILRLRRTGPSAHLPPELARLSVSLQEYRDDCALAVTGTIWSYFERARDDPDAYQYERSECSVFNGTYHVLKPLVLDKKEHVIRALLNLPATPSGAVLLEDRGPASTIFMEG